jgi:hypothetical protein
MYTYVGLWVDEMYYLCRQKSAQVRDLPHGMA